MIPGQNRPPVALIAGPTASGKSAVALRLAEMTGGIIINADASQVYADLAIITARPSAEEMARAPHRLFGHVDGAEDYSAARWAAEARVQIDAAQAQGRPAILVGGTGLYLDTLLNGIAPVPDIDPDIRDSVRALPVSESYDALLREDPEAAARLKPADTLRVARALEVVRSTGRPIADWQQHREGGILGTMTIRAAVVLKSRTDLADRAERRLAIMMATGAIEEVAALLERPLAADKPVLRALGVREIGAALAGEIDMAEASARILKATLAYQKRQLTWARNRQTNWLRVESDEMPMLETITVIGNHLEAKQ